MSHKLTSRHHPDQAAGSPLKLLCFRLGEHDFAVDAIHLAHIRPASSLASSTPIHELAREVGVRAPPSSQIATFASPPERHAHELPLWLGLGHHVEIITCSSHNILVFPPWLGGHSSRHLLPACLHASTLDPDASKPSWQASPITWLLDMTTLRAHIYERAFAPGASWR